MTAPCRHLDTIADVPAPGDVCVICIQIGSPWHHLRQCMHCGITLCCDSSPNRHMTAHHNETGHPIVRSGQPDEDWAWCYVDEVTMRPLEGGGWQAFDPFLETGAWAAQEHLGGGGSWDIDEDYETDDGFPLGRWVSYAREQHDDGALDDQEVAMMESLPGWTW